MRAILLATVVNFVVLITQSASSPAQSEIMTSLPEAEIIFLNSADSMILYAISPDPVPDSKGNFYDYHVISSTELKTAKGRRILVACLRHAIDCAKDSAACFNPHHAIRASKGSQAHEFLICFECGEVSELGPLRKVSLFG